MYIDLSSFQLTQHLSIIDIRIRNDIENTSNEYNDVYNGENKYVFGFVSAAGDTGNYIWSDFALDSGILDLVLSRS